MRFVIRPTADPKNDVDLTERLTAAIAEEIWLRYGGNERLNWLEAELHLQSILGGESAPRRSGGRRDSLLVTRRLHDAARRDRESVGVR
ncbi:MAG: hypothetical protein EA423_12085 [Phycisphaerales bacterium]|nr:MAG: hypothetical protein EA423_12085 [Phycisphaerales bacterium]